MGFPAPQVDIFHLGPLLYFIPRLRDTFHFRTAAADVQIRHDW